DLSKPVIAAVDGYAVAGGLELACWCDLRVVSPGTKFGVFCRRFGVPLIDGGTIRLPRLIGASRAMDMILTGREVSAEEALAFGLANYVSEEESALPHALEVARRIAKFPQICMRTDRASAIAQWSLPMDEALRREIAGGLNVIEMGETRDGAKRFAAGVGRGGLF
ncbi:MAG TPA: enoyl-CoA hydratase, partial [Hyphomonas adhaerens]|nr:enoyl-CoA hydratase [Hyphomonas adhaerens]